MSNIEEIVNPDEFDLGKGRADISRGNALVDGIKAEWIMYKISATLYKSYTIHQDIQVYYITYSATDAGIFGAFAHHFEYIVSSMKFHDSKCEFSDKR